MLDFGTLLTQKLTQVSTDAHRPRTRKTLQGLQLDSRGDWI